MKPTIIILAFVVAAVLSYSFWPDGEKTSAFDHVESVEAAPLAMVCCLTVLSLSYSPKFGQFLSQFKLLFASADRFPFLFFLSSTQVQAVFQHVRCVVVCDCKIQSTFRCPPGPVIRFPKRADRRIRI